MDLMQIVLLGGTGITLATGVVMSIRKRPRGEVVEQVVLQDEIATCAVCGADADEYDDQRMGWVCDRHVPLQSRPPVQQGGRQSRKQVPQTQTQRPRAYIDPHDVATVRDERVLRQAQSFQDYYDDDDDYVYYDEDLCAHGQDPERCRACYVEQDRRARSVQRRPVQHRPVQSVQRRPVQQVGADTELLEDVIELVVQYPNISDAQLAKSVGIRPELARAYRLLALKELAPQAPISRRSRR